MLKYFLTKLHSQFNFHTLPVTPFKVHSVLFPVIRVNSLMFFNVGNCQLIFKKLFLTIFMSTFSFSNIGGISPESLDLLYTKLQSNTRYTIQFIQGVNKTVFETSSPWFDFGNQWSISDRFLPI